MLKVGIVGLGGISRVHRRAYLHLAREGKAELVAGCDIDEHAFSRRVSINLDEGEAPLEEKIRFYTSLDEMLLREQLDLIDICTPTYLHAELSTALLRRGYHVLCEKPMALHAADCDGMLRAVEESGRQLMIGQCLRFYPAFDFIKNAIDENRFGALLGGFFWRSCPPPDWGYENWFLDGERSGGCLTDVHVHDIDVIRYLFGEPDAVSCRASSSVSLHATAHTALFYGDTPLTAVGDWSLTGIPFSAFCQINFAAATLRFDGKTLSVYPKEEGAAPYEVPLQGMNGYYEEIAYFCDVVEGRIKNTKNPPSSAANSIRLIEKMRQSAAASGEIIRVTGA